MVEYFGSLSTSLPIYQVYPDNKRPTALEVTAMRVGLVNICERVRRNAIG